MTRILRYEVPVDDEWHHVHAHDPLYVGCRRTDIVEFWAWEIPDSAPVYREYRVVGTGHHVEEAVQYIGTAIAPGGSLVWHLVQR